MGAQLETNSYVEDRETVKLFLKHCKLSGLDIEYPPRIGTRHGGLGFVRSVKCLKEGFIYPYRPWLRMEVSKGVYTIWMEDAFDEWEFKTVDKMLEKANQLIQEWL